MGQFTKKIKLKFSRFILDFKKDKILNESLILKNKFENKKCYIIGNAPSINNHDLKLLKNESTFVVNTFFVHKEFYEISPNFYVFADPDLWNFADPAITIWWTQLIEKSINNGIVFFLPLQFKDTFVSKKLEKEKVYYLNFTVNLTFKSAKIFDLTYPINGVQNVLILCIQIAIYLGFTEIYLLGADHDWLTHFGNEQRHFYTSSDNEVKDCGATGYPYNWWLNSVHLMFQQYKFVQEVALLKNIKIYNASESGVLDIFPLVKYLNTFKQLD